MNNHVTKPNWFSSISKLHETQTMQMPSGPVPNVAGIRKVLYQNDQWTYIGLQLLRFGWLKPIDASKNELKHSKNTYVRQASWMLPSVSIHTNNRQECFAPFRKSKQRTATEQWNSRQRRPQSNVIQNNLSIFNMFKQIVACPKVKPNVTKPFYPKARNLATSQPHQTT